MAEKFDLIVKLDDDETSEEYLEEMVIEQVESKLKNTNAKYFIKETEYFNIFMVELNQNKIQKTVKIENACEPHNLEIIPIDSVVKTKPETIKNKIMKLSTRIKTGDTFSIDCNMRGKYIKTKEEFIHDLTQRLVKMKKKPDESNPDWIIHIEVLGQSTGISILKNNP